MSVFVLGVGDPTEPNHQPPYRTIALTYIGHVDGMVGGVWVARVLVVFCSEV